MCNRESNLQIYFNFHISIVITRSLARIISQLNLAVRTNRFFRSYVGLTRHPVAKRQAFRIRPARIINRRHSEVASSSAAETSPPPNTVPNIIDEVRANIAEKEKIMYDLRKKLGIYSDSKTVRIYFNFI